MEVIYMASYRKRGKTWEYRVNWTDAHGNQQVQSCGGFVLRKSAEAEARRMEELILRGGEPNKNDILFLDYWDQWIEAYKSGNKSKNTEYRYELIRGHLEHTFAGRKLKSITGTEWQIFLNNLAAGADRKRQRPRSQDFISKTNSYVRAMVKTAINEQIIFKDFTFNVDVRGIRHSEKMKYLESEDFKRVKQISEEKASFRSMGNFAIYIASMTGMRISEILGLTWSDIDEANGVIHVNKSWDHIYGTGFKATKTPASIRDIEVSTAVFDVFKRVHKEQLSVYLRQGYRDQLNMVMRGRQHTVLTDNACNKSLANIQTSIDVPKDRFITFHGLRHSHVSYLISQGVDIYYISRRIGHSNISVTLKVYSHLLDSQRRKEAEKSVRILDSL